MSETGKGMGLTYHPEDMSIRDSDNRYRLYVSWVGMSYRTATAESHALGRQMAAVEELVALCDPDFAGRPLDVLLDTVADVLNQGGGGPLVDCLRAKAEQARVAVAKLEGA